MEPNYYSGQQGLANHPGSAQRGPLRSDSLAGILEQISHITKHCAAIDTRLSMIANTLDGGLPPAATSKEGAAAGISPGTMAEIVARLAGISMLCESITSKLDRIEPYVI